MRPRATGPRRRMRAWFNASGARGQVAHPPENAPLEPRPNDTRKPAVYNIDSHPTSISKP